MAVGRTMSGTRRDVCNSVHLFLGSFPLLPIMQQTSITAPLYPRGRISMMTDQSLHCSCLGKTYQQVRRAAPIIPSAGIGMSLSVKSPPLVVTPGL